MNEVAHQDIAGNARCMYEDKNGISLFFLYRYTTLLTVFGNFLLIKLGGKCLWVALISRLSHKLFLWYANLCYGLWVC